MSTRTRNALAVLAAVAIVLIAGGVLFDCHETRAYAECMNGPWMTFSVGDLTAPEPNNGAYTGTSWEFGCDEASRAGVVVAGIGAVLLAIAVLAWWVRRRAAGPGWE
ncbi:hypothetical protein GS894_23900 [Rhodococcus hoagii]|nr:hypothetical protein [Prescottella equi]NKS85645.1 hypothetical protein [Prescottella equi]NKT12007.1 hypothetical protein [Prescottella equi]NKT16209.1 hypothetical protein [Prescottella equi]NKT16274.1 hypothetical protein [Prescottella equi]